MKKKKQTQGCKKKYTKHHIMPSSRGGSDSEINIIQLRDKTHVALHSLFGNKTPEEQFMALIDINAKALNHAFVTEYKDLVNDYRMWLYENGVLRPSDEDEG